MTDFDRPKEPLPEPLMGTDSGSFAEYTIAVRLPNILREVIEFNDFSAEVMVGLEALLEEIPQARVRTLQDPGAPDLADWNRYIQPVAGSKWIQLPWFFAETYFYRRILEATGYFQPGLSRRRDPYLRQKRQVLEQGLALGRALSAELEALREGAQTVPAQKWVGLRRLIMSNLWGNQADLSMWSVDDEGRPEHTDVEQQEAHLLVDDSQAVVDYLAALEKPARVDFLIDNAGLELLYDLALTDYLLGTEAASSVVYHLKAHPTFVSDAMIKDVEETVDTLALQPDPALRDLSQRLKRHLAEGRLKMAEDFYWNSPLPGWEMPASIRQELGRSDLLVSKGDANYRRLLGDRHWPPATALKDVVRYLPVPVLLLRVAKAEIAVGLAPGQAEELDRIDPDWRVDGDWGMIQFAG
jgi:uncharacterized protein with ATP-grasp and redox domains